MTSEQRPIDEAVAFFDLFLHSDWASCHVRGGGIELFVARAGEVANPLLGIVDGETHGDAESALLTAPHLCTLVDLATIGSSVAAGERYGAIELLGETIDLVSDRAGVIRRHIGRPGALVQFDEPLAALSE